MLLQPINDKLKVVDERQLAGIELSFFGNHGQLSPKLAIFFPDHCAAWNSCLARRGLEPVANIANRGRRTLVVRLNILTANVGDKAFISISGAIQDQAPLSRGATSKSFRAKKNSELQGHIEAGQLIRLVFNLRSRNVMNAVITLGYQTIDILNSDLTCIGELQCAAQDKSAGRNTKHNRLEQWLELFIKRTVDKYARAGGRRHFGLSVFDDQMNSLS